LFVYALQRVAKRRPVSFEQNRSVGLDHIVRPDPDDVVVESAVMQDAHGDSVRNNRLSTFAVLLDVRRVEEFGVSKVAKSTPPCVGRQHALAKDALVDAALHGRSCILASKRRVSWVRQEVALNGPVVPHAFIDRVNVVRIVRACSSQETFTMPRCCTSGRLRPSNSKDLRTLDCMTSSPDCKMCRSRKAKIAARTCPSRSSPVTLKVCPTRDGEIAASRTRSRDWLILAGGCSRTGVGYTSP
jgi:hypothetical protein